MKKLNLTRILILNFAVFAFVTTQSFAQEKAQPIFKDGEAQIVKAFDTPDKWIRTDLWVETTFDTDGDGKLDRMHVDVTRPFQTETEGLKLAVIYGSSPYYAGVSEDGPNSFWDVKQEVDEKPPYMHDHPSVKRTGNRPIISNEFIYDWVKRGYIIVHSSSPGTGLSDGSPTVGGINESLAPKAVIEWLSGKDNGYTSRTGDEKVKAYWSTGNVGMTGTSYNGTIPLAAATTGVEGLKAIIPVAPNTSYYHYYRSNGLVRSPGGYLGEDIDVLYDFIHSGAEEKRAYGDRVVRDGEMMKGMDREKGDYNKFWAGRDYLNQMKPMKAALFMSHGFNDWNVMAEHSYRIYKAAEKMGLPVKIYYHQEGHGGEPPFTMMNRWFTKYLYNIDNGVENEPKAWIVRENDKNDNPTPYADFPNPAASDVKLYLTAGGNSAGKLSVAPTENQNNEKLVDDVSISGSDLAKAEKSDHRLLYVTPILKEAVHLSGLTQISVRLASSKKAANFSVWLVALPWSEGKGAKLMDNIITRGWADPQNSKSLTKSKPLKPGKFYNLKFNLQPDDQIIPAGKQIGVVIFSSDKEFTLWPKPGTEITIDLNHTTLTLPVVNGANAFEKATK
ncbi:Xaa-Pro dipeptidyl-peptidase [Pedobacter changchengzhani]|uniref:Xaa-Pro dipeptidyl-peptidase n=1 Tax=Pedobacter changchengzhani TaxID=2529274 RepID=A0A4R5MKE3_9SPHI|nr:Xaa-Pro dipeptidyl-peptidase [Pedobacter changchengzhani]TDG35559.1 Xaa-Pro dipeptidyl-peptidase [Pedobacter changchengzhani]